MAIKIDGKESQYAKMGEMLLLDSLLSLLLFTYLSMSYSRVLRYRNKEVDVGSTRINTLIYAADIVIIFKIEEVLQIRPKNCEKYTRRNSYVHSLDSVESLASAPS